MYKRQIINYSNASTGKSDSLRYPDEVNIAISSPCPSVISVSYTHLAGADTLATSYAIATAIRNIGECPLIIGGRQAIDGDTAQAGPQVEMCIRDRCGILKYSPPMVIHRKQLLKHRILFLPMFRQGYIQ